MLRTACTQARTWQQAGQEGFRIAVNVSPTQLREKDFVTIVESILGETGLTANTLELEITEGSLVQSSDEMLRVMHELREMGINLAVDDFGTGYSALAYLKDLPIDTLKIDQSFVQSLMAHPANATIVQAIVLMAHALNLATVAEGVEDYDQLHLLGSYGCTALARVSSRPPGSGARIRAVDRESFVQLGSLTSAETLTRKSRASLVRHTHSSTPSACPPPSRSASLWPAKVAWPEGLCMIACRKRPREADLLRAIAALRNARWRVPHGVQRVARSLDTGRGNTAAVAEKRWDDMFYRRAAQMAALPERARYRVVFLGDSITQRWADAGSIVWDRYYRDLPAANFGINGDRTQACDLAHPERRVRRHGS